jgi:hypothetical protein
VINPAFRLLALAGGLLVSSAIQSAAQDPLPKALVAMMEVPDMAMPNGPLPLGLRFVLYDDGLVLVRLPWSDRQGKVIQTGRLSASETSQIHRDITAWLAGPAPTLTGDHSWTDQGSTIIDIWDPGGGRYRSFRTYGMPCKNGGSDRTDPSAPDRRLTDPRFLKACDWLLQYRVAIQQAWVPDAITLFLGIAETPLQEVYDWPKDAPQPRVEPDVFISHCIAGSALPSDLVQHLITSNRDILQPFGFRLSVDRVAEIRDWQFELPGGVPQFDRDGNVRKFLGRFCSEP